MDSFLAQVKSFMPEVHFYVMWFSFLSSLSCVLSSQASALFKPNIAKIIVFVLLLFAGFTWVHDVTQMKNTEDFSNSDSELTILSKKHEYSKLQRDVYLEGLEVYSLLLLLIIPRFHQYYIQTIKSYDRRLNLENKSKLILKAYTWPRDSHGLYDYESKTVTKDKLKIQDSISLSRVDNNITWFYPSNEASSPVPLLTIEKTLNGFLIKSGQCGEMWKVINCNKAKPPSTGHELNAGEIVKLGRVKYIVKEVCGYEEDSFRPALNNFTSNKRNIDEQNLCRICLVGEEENDPLISPCNCGGTMKFIHLSCFRKWIDSRTSKKQTETSLSYFVKSLTCEISRCPILPTIQVQDQEVDLLSIQRVEPPFIILETKPSEKNEYSIHLISLNNKNNVRLGRGHDSDIRISDISVSRCHAIIKFYEGQFVLEDNSSKFGTLIEGKEILINKNCTNACIQVGRTLIVLNFNNGESESQDLSIEETDEEQE